MTRAEPIRPVLTELFIKVHQMNSAGYNWKAEAESHLLADKKLSSLDKMELSAKENPSQPAFLVAFSCITLSCSQTFIKAPLSTPIF